MSPIMSNHGTPLTDSPLVCDLRARLGRVRQDVAAAAGRAGRDPAEITIVAVSKRQPAAAIEAAHAAGVRDVGENYAQELTAKLTELAGSACAGELGWHFIGKLQRNKVKYVVGRAVLIHAVDSLALAEEIDRVAAARAFAGEAGGHVQRVLLAVNLAGEAQKSGVDPSAAPALLEAMAGLAHVCCTGLMTMPPFADSPEDSRPYFRALAELRDRLRSPRQPLSELSMGTTGDFPVAVEEGATLVRVGTAIFGSRQ